MENTFILDVDLKKHNYIDTPQVRQNDDITFIVNVNDDDEPFDLSQVTTLTLAIKRSDGNTVLSVGQQTGDNQATFKLPRSSVSIVGNGQATVQLYDEENRVSTFTFPIKILKDPSDYVPDDGDKTLIELVLGDGPQILSDAQEAADYVQAKKPLVDKFTSEQSNLQTQLNDLTKGLTEDAEVIQARGGFSVLNDRLNDADKRFNDLEIGGRNLAVSTGVQFTRYDLSPGDYGVVLSDNEFKIYKTHINGITMLFPSVEVKVNEEYIINANISEDTPTDIAGVAAYDSEGNLLEIPDLITGDLRWIQTYKSYLLSTDSKITFPVKFKINSPLVKYVRMRLGEYRGQMVEGDIIIKDPELRKGTKSLGWELSYEDLMYKLNEKVKQGAGSPEGVITAPVGALYTRTDGGENTTLYVKESGAGNTGWVAK